MKRLQSSDDAPSSTPSSTTPEKKAPGGNTICLPVKLDAVGTANANITFVAETAGGFMYVRNPPPSDHKSSSGHSGDTPPSASSAAVKTVTAKLDTKKREAVAEAKLEAEAEVDAEAEAAEESEMKWACDVSTLRLLKKAKPATVGTMLEEFGVGTDITASLGAQECASLLAEQLHYETDDDADDDGSE